jgi:hypothetical protein
MKRIRISRSLYAISAFLMMLSFLGWSTAASNDPVFLTCHPSGFAGSSIYVTIDYSRRTVVTSEVNDTGPKVDAEGHTSQPAKITDSQVRWQLPTKRATGRVCTQHFTLSRLTGDLHIYDNGFSNPRIANESWTCQVSAKPTPKF